MGEGPTVRSLQEGGARALGRKGWGSRRIFVYDERKEYYACQRDILQPAGRRSAHGEGFHLHPPEPMQPPL